MAVREKVQVSFDQESMRVLKGVQQALNQQNRLMAEQNALLRGDATGVLEPVEVPSGD